MSRNCATCNDVTWICHCPIVDDFERNGVSLQMFRTVQRGCGASERQRRRRSGCSSSSGSGGSSGGSGGGGGVASWMRVGESVQSSVRAPVFFLNPNVTLLRCFQNSWPPRNFFRNRDDFRDHMSQPGILGTLKLEFFSFRRPPQTNGFSGNRNPVRKFRIPDSDLP